MTELLKPLSDGSLFYREERTLMWEKGSDTIFLNGEFKRAEFGQINKIINEGIEQLDKM